MAAVAAALPQLNISANETIGGTFYTDQIKCCSLEIWK
jgi:hypothetical protein